MTLRTRLVAGTAVVALVLVGGSVVVLRITEAHLLAQVDHRLENSARKTLPVGPEELDEQVPGPDQDDGPNVSSVFVAFVDPGSGTMVPLELPDDQPGPDISGADALEAVGRDPFTAGSPESDLRWRTIVQRHEQTGLVVVIARPLDDIDGAVDRLLLVEILCTGLVLLAMGLVTWWVVHLGVRPIKRMTTTAARIAGGDLTQRISDARPGTEAGQLGTALNTMLGRIEASFARQAESEARLRRFVADASHELRTPLSTVRGYAELYRNRGLTDPDAMDDAMRRTEEEALRMSALVDDLVVLARYDEGRPLDCRPVNLSRIVRDAARDAREVDPTRRITVTVRPVRVVGDEPRLRQVVANIVGNALVHTPAGTGIDLRVGPAEAEGRAGFAEVEVTDHGPGMAEPDAARAFERFYRADPGRSRHSGGSGLGLAIVHSTISAHGGTVGLTSEPGEGTTVRFTLPAPTPHDRPAPHRRPTLRTVGP